MTEGGARRPLLFLDVDGPLNPFEAKPTRRPAGYVTHHMRPTGWDAPEIRPLRVWLNPTHGASLLALPFDLVWATTWGTEANEWIAPVIGLPALPVVEWPQGPRTDSRLHWKTRALREYAGGRPFAWVDDEIGPEDRAWIAEHHGAPALLHRVGARRGLLPDDFARLAAWADQLGDATT